MAFVGGDHGATVVTQGAVLAARERIMLEVNVSGEDLAEWRKQWQIHPAERYTVQLSTKSGQAIVDVTVRLVDADGQSVPAQFTPLARWGGAADDALAARRPWPGGALLSVVV